MALVHGGDITSFEEEYGCAPLDFSANINPLGMPESVRLAAVHALGQAERYPDPLCRALVSALAAHEHVPAECLVCGNGAADLIFRLVLAKKPRRALLPAPTFAEYQQALEAVGCTPVFYPLTQETGFAPTESLLDALTGVDMVFLCNPNNPTGVTADTGLLQQLAARCLKQKITLVVDECFNDFLDNPERHSLKPLLAENPFLVILKAFTKLYAMPGLRLGYCMCSAELAERLRVCGQPWAVSGPAQAAGIAALKETGFVEESRALIKQERAFLKAELNTLGFSLVFGEANYLLFHTDSPDLGERMRMRGILIRPCANYRGLGQDWYRIAVRLRADNELLLTALKETV